MANGYECYCGRAWMSVTPPPPCPIHSNPQFTYRVTKWSNAPLCRGRHCQHDMYCRGGVTFNG